MLCSSTDTAISVYSTNTLRESLCRFPGSDPNPPANDEVRQIVESFKSTH